jgi:glycosyltransferase involved in cell wall biosynthesis
MAAAGIPEVSVVITTFNRLWSLPRAISSCRENVCSTQIIVVDDGSTDGTWEWLQGQPDVLAIRTRNWGKCWAANTGVAAATGSYVRFLDSDDWLEPGANDRQLAAARAADADLVLAGQVYVDDAGNVLGECMPPAQEDFLAKYVRQVWSSSEISYCACLIRHSVAAAIPHRAEYHWHDVLFMLELALSDPVIARCDFPSLHVRQHSRDRRISDPQGLDRALAVHSTVALCRKVLAAVQDRDGPGARSAAQWALLDALWSEARKLAEFDVREATALARWIAAQHPDFRPQARGALRAAYKVLGFRLTERLAARHRALRGN